MNEIIKQIEALKEVLTTQERKEMSVSEYEAVAIKNNTISDVLDILRKQQVIKCKALRKKGTNEFYTFDMEESTWKTKLSWHPVYKLNTKKKHFFLLPEDAELKEIEILIK